jgi:hypothetical protein
VFDDGVRQHEIEGAVAERQGHAVGEREVEMGERALARQAHAGVAEAVEGIDAHHLPRLLGQRQRHAAAAAAGVEHTAGHADARALEEREDLRAAVVLEQRVVVFGAEPLIRVRLDGAFVNDPHACRSGQRYRCRSAIPPRRNS